MYYGPQPKIKLSYLTLSYKTIMMRHLYSFASMLIHLLISVKWIPL